MKSLLRITNKQVEFLNRINLGTNKIKINNQRKQLLIYEEQLQKSTIESDLKGNNKCIINTEWD